MRPERGEMGLGKLRLQPCGLRVEAPAIEYSTVELVRMAEVPASVLAWAHSCHKANLPCGQCRGCNKFNDCMYELGFGGTLR